MEHCVEYLLWSQVQEITCHPKTLIRGFTLFSSLYPVTQAVVPVTYSRTYTYSSECAVSVNTVFVKYPAGLQTVGNAERLVHSMVTVLLM